MPQKILSLRIISAAASFAGEMAWCIHQMTPEGDQCWCPLVHDYSMHAPAAASAGPPSRCYPHPYCSEAACLVASLSSCLPGSASHNCALNDTVAAAGAAAGAFAKCSQKRLWMALRVHCSAGSCHQPNATLHTVAHSHPLSTHSKCDKHRIRTLITLHKGYTLDILLPLRGQCP